MEDEDDDARERKKLFKAKKEAFPEIRTGRPCSALDYNIILILLSVCQLSIPNVSLDTIQALYTVFTLTLWDHRLG